MKIDNETLLTEIRRLVDDLDRVPRSSDMTKYGSHSLSTYSDRFGSWNNALQEAGFEPNQEYNIQRDDLIEDIQRVAMKIGHPPTLGEIKQHGRYSHVTYLDNFESWSDALTQANLTTDHNSTKYIRDDVLLRHLQELAEQLGYSPSRQYMETRGKFHPTTYEDRFGSWNDALEEADLEIREKHPIPKEELISELQRVNTQTDANPTITDMKNLGEYSDTTYRTRFGSWGGALAAAGLKPDYQHGEISKEKLIAELHRLAVELGHPPSTTDMKKHGNHSVDTYYNHFSSWDDALTTAQLDSSSG